MVNEAYINLTLNWLCNTYVLSKNLHENLFIIGLNNKTCDRLLEDWPKIACLSFESDIEHNGSLNWGENSYVQILNLRAELLLKLVAENIDFVLFETDSVWLKNPMDIFKNTTIIDDADIVVPINNPSIHMTKEKYAFDPMVVYSTNASKKLFIEMKERLENQHGLMDQVSWSIRVEVYTVFPLK